LFNDISVKLARSIELVEILIIHQTKRIIEKQKIIILIGLSRFVFIIF